MPETEISQAELEAQKAAYIKENLKHWFMGWPQNFSRDGKADELGINESDIETAFIEFEKENPDEVKKWREEQKELRGGKDF